MFSKACTYGLRAMLWIAANEMAQDPQRASLKVITEHTGAPEAFMGKILQTLTHSKLLNSSKGPNGGFSLVKAPKKILLRDIVVAIDGDALFTECSLGYSTCDTENPCPMHHKFIDVRRKINDMVINTTLSDYSHELIDGKAVLKR